MKRRIDALASSTSKATSKKRSWKEDDEVGEKATKRKQLKSDNDEDNELMAESRALEEAETDPDKAPLPTTGPNPVVWMDLTIAGKERGKCYFELFADVAPKAVNNFRRLCTGMEVGGDTVGYKGTEFENVFSGRFAEGGELDRSVDVPAIERESSLEHAKGGLLSMAIGNPSYGTTRFQLTLRPRPELDGKQVVLGQLLQEKDIPGKLHPLYWVEAVGSSSGAPRETVVITACGECDSSEAEQVLGPMVIAAALDRREPESQEDRYARAGINYGKLQDAVRDDCIEDVLELTDDVLENLEWDAKKAKKATEKDRKAMELEAISKDLTAVVKDVETKVGEGTWGKKAQSFLVRLRDVDQSLTRLY